MLTIRFLRSAKADSTMKEKISACAHQTWGVPQTQRICNAMVVQILLEYLS